jgi:hypothetical protein
MGDISTTSGRPRRNAPRSAHGITEEPTSDSEPHDRLALQRLETRHQHLISGENRACQQDFGST